MSLIRILSQLIAPMAGVRIGIPPDVTLQWSTLTRYLTRQYLDGKR